MYSSGTSGHIASAWLPPQSLHILYLLPRSALHTHIHGATYTVAGSDSTVEIQLWLFERLESSCKVISLPRRGYCRNRPRCYSPCACMRLQMYPHCRQRSSEGTQDKYYFLLCCFVLHWGVEKRLIMSEVSQPKAKSGVFLRKKPDVILQRRSLQTL